MIPTVHDSASGKILSQDVKAINGEISVGLSDVQRYPGKHWLENVGFEIVSFSIADAGSGYRILQNLQFKAVEDQVQQLKHLLVMVKLQML